MCVFGNRGVGKTHLMAAGGRALVERGQPVLFVAGQALVQRPVEAMRELRLARELPFTQIRLPDVAIESLCWLGSGGEPARGPARRPRPARRLSTRSRLPAPRTAGAGSSGTSHPG